MTQDKATNLIACFLLGLIATLAFIPVVASLIIKPAHADDWKRPDLDGWYSGPSELFCRAPARSECRDRAAHAVDAGGRNHDNVLAETLDTSLRPKLDR